MSPVERIPVYTGQALRERVEAGGNSSALYVRFEDHQAALEAERQRVLDALLALAADKTSMEELVTTPSLYNVSRQTAEAVLADFIPTALQSLTQEKPCETCGGRGFRTGGVFPRCPVCKGTGKDPDCTETPSEEELGDGSRWSGKTKDEVIEILETRLGERGRELNEALDTELSTPEEKNSTTTTSPSGGTGEKPPCGACEGRGWVQDGPNASGTCPDCKGSGEKPVESGDGETDREFEFEKRLRRVFATQRDEAWAKLAKVNRALGPDGAAADVGAARAALFTQPGGPDAQH